uniref:Uncharacterized protein n=1 Tax=Anguilla anguilla TaxID=7936 RepID=A0A0E9PKA2_ANGAN
MIDDHCQLSIRSTVNFIFNLFFYTGLFKDYRYYLKTQWTFRMLKAI